MGQRYIRSISICLQTPEQPRAFPFSGIFDAIDDHIGVCARPNKTFGGAVRFINKGGMTAVKPDGEPIWIAVHTRAPQHL